MTKVSTPLLSLEAHGRLGNDVFFTSGQTGKIAKKMPTTTDPRTWPQLYHRWLYQDYASLWKQLSDATRLTWNTLARGTTRSGFNLFLQEMLSTMPDIKAAYHLDCHNMALAQDFSPNGNHGTPTGTTAAAGVFDQARHFDGIDEILDCGNDPRLDINTDLSIECWFFPSALGRFHTLASKGPDTAYNLRVRDNNTVQFYIRQANTTIRSANTIATINPNTWNHIVGNAEAGQPLRVFLDGLLSLSGDTFTDIETTISNLIIGARSPPPLWGFTKGGVDEITIRNRHLDPTDILAHYRRRSQ